MDGTFAVLFLIAGFTDMSMNYCDEGCFAKRPAQERFGLSAGEVQFQRKAIGNEIYARWDLDHSFGPFQNAVGFSATDSNDYWIGFGQLWTYELGQRAYVQLHAMPGLYHQGSGPDLGLPLEFRSGIEVGYENRNGWRFGLSYDHRSNAGLSSVNPGMETVQFRVSVPLK